LRSASRFLDRAVVEFGLLIGPHDGMARTSQTVIRVNAVRQVQTGWTSGLDRLNMSRTRTIEAV
jgi:hypothetical protein